MFRDNEFPMSYGAISIVPSEPVNQNDDLDDVFGSAPGSPTLEGREDHEDEIFRIGNREISDIPRLKEKHETEGYRDGVTQGKAESVQKGFDEGYGLGAVLGIKIGRVIGVLEGVLGAVSVSAKEIGDNGMWLDEKERLTELVKNAKEDLKTENVFAKKWWGEDGIWKFEVPGENDGNDVVFPDVAAAHPLIKQWEEIIEKEIQRWSLDPKLMDGNEENIPVVQHTKAPAVERKTDLNW